MSAPARPWDPEVVIDVAWATELCAFAWPGRLGDLRPFGSGWDNEAFLATDAAGDTWVVRFPRRALGGELMEHELAVLPGLGAYLEALAHSSGVGVDLGGARLALPVPDLRQAATPGAPRDYPWSFGAYRMLAGTTACRAGLPGPGARVGGERVGAFLAALHHAPEELRELAPPEPASRANRVARWEAMGRRLAELAPRSWSFVARGAGDPVPFAEPHGVDVLGAGSDFGLPLAPADVHVRARPWAELLGRRVDVLAHGDLYGRHVMVDPASGAPTGIIDWGDVHVGDAAGDLALGWSFFQGAPRAAFLAAYRSGVVLATGRDPFAEDAHLADRARFRALDYAVLLLLFGQETDDEALLRLGRDAWWGALQ